MRYAVLVLFIVLLVGCAAPGRNFEAGSVTHRMWVVESEGVENKGEEARDEGAESEGGEEGKGNGRPEADVDVNGGRDGTRKASRWSQYFEDQVTSGLLRPGDSVAIRLLSVYVCDFTESNPFPEDVLRWGADLFLDPEDGLEYPPRPCSKAGIARSKHYTRGEIVILVDAFEQGSGTIINYQKDTTTPSNARVIYYDDDVRESGQYLSISNLPVYGPITYGGNALFLRWYILELDDDENAQMGSVLSRLAELGGKAYPPASPVLKALSSVGGALLSGEQDDLEFRYTMAFDPYDGLSTSRAPLAVGTYVIAKQDDRSRDLDWTGVKLDPTTGALTKGGSNERLRLVTYLVFKVTRNEPALEQDGLQIYSAFQETPVAAGPAFDSITSSAEAAGAFVRSAAQFDQARGHLSLLAAPDPNEVRKAQATENLRQMICSALEKDPKPGSLLDRQIEYILSELPEACDAPKTIEKARTWCETSTELCPQAPPAPPAGSEQGT